MTVTMTDNDNHNTNDDDDDDDDNNNNNVNNNNDNNILVNIYTISGGLLLQSRALDCPLDFSVQNA